MTPTPDKPPTISFWRDTLRWDNPYLRGWLALGQLAELAVCLAGAVLVWWLAGGTGEQMHRMWATRDFLGDGRPALAGLVAFLMALFASTLSEAMARSAHNRLAREWHAARTAHRPAGSGTDPRDVLERLVLLRGPLTWDQMHDRFGVGGEWGPAVFMSKYAMGRLLKDQTTGQPVAWLVAQGGGGLYVHRDAAPATTPQENPKSDADHTSWGSRNR